MLHAIIRQPHYFVRHYYTRGLRDDNAIPLLFSHYSHHEIDRERAFRHVRLLKKDPHRFLYNSEDPIHRERLQRAAMQPQGFRVYTNVLPDKWQPTPALRKRIYAYVNEKFGLTHNSADRINIKLQDLYGKLYLFLTLRTTTIEVLLEDIELFGERMTQSVATTLTIETTSAAEICKLHE